MSAWLHEHAAACPCCGARFTALVDTSEGPASYTQDCEVCCRPLLFRVTPAADGSVTIEVAREDDGGI